ncbi:hypothetical protein GCM10023322_23720 [Rugosimonospora acidiphila]|uniref:Lipoprotein LprG n=1 Tax=Rugosimonospora acidiphila TaxID=556531 RepID=A0ABP9RPP4_9ACTN
MNTRRIALAGAAALAVLGFAAGCSTGKTTAAGSAGNATGAAASSSSDAPKTALLASTKQLGQQSYRYTISAAGMSGSGAIDPAAKSTSISLSGVQAGAPMKIDDVTVGTDVYLKVDAGQLGAQLGVAPDKWMHLDTSSLGAGELMALPGADQEGVNQLLSGVVNVTSTDGNNLSGTIDLTKASGSSALDAAALSAAGDKAKAVPFTAVLDDQGRLSTLKIDGSGIVSGLTVQMAFSDYGQPANITKPAASSVVEAPDAIQQLLKR